MPKLELSFLGRFEIALNGQPVAVHLTAKAQALLSFLAIEGDEPHRRDALAGLLWPEQPNEAARNSLRQALHQLSQALGNADPPFLLVTPQTVQFNPACDHSLDVAEFMALIQACEIHRHRHRETCQSCISRLQRVLALYRGGFLADFFLKDTAAFEEWALVEREQLERTALGALNSLTEYHARRGELALMEQVARRQTAIDPFQENAHRQLMRALAWGGRRTDALAHFEVMRRKLLDELGTPPEWETAALRAQIESDTLVPHEPAPLRNWPSSLTTFVGREEELAQLAAYLHDPDLRLITLIGPGGMGKTRLALQAAEQAVFDFCQGACFVPLADVSTPEYIVPSIVHALQLPFVESSDLKSQLIDYLHDTKQDLLLVLDSMERCVKWANSVSDILRACPSVRFLVTSRERLNLEEEWQLHVQGLVLPDPGVRTDLEAYSAVQLFLQRARQARPEFALSEADRPAVGHICALVGGMPLALELSAAWVGMISCADIAREIEHGLSFLTSPWRDAPERHRSLRAVFEQAWSLLDEEEQQAFRRLAVFRGGFRRESAEAVVGRQWLVVGSQLVDKSMLQISQSGRYEQHPLVHQYAEEKLAQWPHEQQRCMEQHGRFYADFLRQRGKRLKGTGQKQASAEIVEEIENVRVAWQWMVTRQRWFEIAKCLESLAYFYLTRSWYQEGATKMGQAVAAMGEARGAFSNPIKAIVRGSALVAQAMFCVYQGQFEQAKNLSANGLHLLRPIGIRRLIALALGWLGLAELNLGQHELAATHLREGLTLATAAKERWLVGVLLTFAGHVAQAKDLAEAIGYYRNSVAAFESIGDQRTVATPLYFLGATLYYSGNLAEAKRCLQECLASARETGVRQQAAWSLASLGDIALNSGDFAEAQHRYQESLALSEEIGDSGLTVVNQAALGIVAGMSGDDAAAKDAFRKACKKTIDMRAWPQLVGLVVRWATFLATQGKIEQKYVVEWVAQALHQPFIKQGDKLLAERLLDRLRATVPPDVLATAQGRGQARPLEEIVNEIMQHETTIGESSCYSEGWMADPAMKKHAAFEI